MAPKIVVVAGDVTLDWYFWKREDTPKSNDKGEDSNSGYDTSINERSRLDSNSGNDTSINERSRLDSNSGNDTSINERSRLDSNSGNDTSINERSRLDSNSGNDTSINERSRLNYGISMHPQFGGALFLSNIIKKNLENSINYKIIDQGNYQEPEDELKHINYFVHQPEEILHRYIKLDLFPSFKELNQKEDKVYRVSEYFGYASTSKKVPSPLPIIGSDCNSADFVIIEDLGLEFRYHKDIWQNSLRKKRIVVIYDMFTPLFKGNLWEEIERNHKKNLVLILDARDLRDLGANISRSLSWEKTALEVLWEINHNENLKEMKDLKNVIIRFGDEGAIHYKGKSEESKLFFDPSKVEGGFWDINKYGSMRGDPLVFTSSLAYEIILKNGISDEAIEVGIVNGFRKCRKFLQEGYDPNLYEKQNYLYKYCGEKLSDEKDKEPRIICQKLELFKPLSTESDPDFWSILKEKTRNKDNKNNLITVAMNIVLNGWSAISDFPTGHFGELTVVDRAEIESFGSLKRIMDGYINAKMNEINSEKSPIPLSISVFGTPGSGKSYGITKVANSIDPNKVYKIGFNVSQFTSTTDLINAFHRIRDISITGKIPLVFFDEFDCSFNKDPLGWLKYFLAPMQDGEFTDSGTIHPIGKSIFVFAGGIYSDFNKFYEDVSSKKNPNKKSEKGDDFISRLRGYVDIIGPNEKDQQDDACIIRRAVHLRSLIEEKVPNILDNSDGKVNIHNRKAKIDENLLRTLLTIKEYKHGVRSMEAIIDMSLLQGQKSWNKSSLPPKDQLRLHVDENEFVSKLVKNGKSENL